MSQVPTIFTAEQNNLIAFDAGKSGVRSITPEGAIFKGGKALKSLKDAAMDSAVSKAVNGRYRPAAEIIGAAFGGVQSAFERVIGSPFLNKDNMRSFLGAVERTKPATGKDFSTKQKNALALVAVLREVDALKPEVRAESDVVAVQ